MSNLRPVSPEIAAGMIAAIAPPPAATSEGYRKGLAAIAARLAAADRRDRQDRDLGAMLQSRGLL